VTDEVSDARRLQAVPDPPPDALRTPPLVVAVPVRDRLDLTIGLHEQLISEAADAILFLDNGSVDDTGDWLAGLRDPRVASASLPGRTLTEMWNIAWGWARQYHGPGAILCLLNNDVTLTPGTLNAMASVVAEDPRVGLVHPDQRFAAPHEWAGTMTETHGSARHHGLTGYCFALPVDLDHRIGGRFDEQFVWWCADDDIAWRTTDAGLLQLRLDELGVSHINEATASAYPHLAQVKADDMARLHAKYPGRW